MMIAVAGPYSAPTEEQRARNLDNMNRAALAVYASGHIPVIGVNAALPIASQLPTEQQYDAIMAISLAVVGACDGILMIGSSPGADRERDLLAALGRPVFHDLDEIPSAEPSTSKPQ